MTARPGRPRWRLQQRIAVALALSGVLLLAVVGGSAALLNDVRDRQDRIVDDTFTAIRLSNQRFVGLLDAETSVRGYALTGDRASLEPLDRARRAGLDRGSAQIRTYLAGADPDVVRALDAADASADAWYRGWALPAVARVTRDGTLPAAEVARGQRLFDRLRADYGRYLDVVRAQRARALDDLQDRTGWLFAATLLSALLSGAVALVLWWLLRRWVTEPVAHLAGQARLVGGGDLELPVRVCGAPELEGLADDIDGMRRHLVDQIAEVEGARRQLAQAHEQLAQQAGELARSNRDLEQFAYVASHDLQEPLRKVSSFCQMLERRYSGQLDERADQYIAYAVDGSRRMQQLINDLLEFSRVGRAGVPEATVDLDACLDDALDQLEVRLAESAATVTRDRLPTVRGDATLLTALLLNLVGNALKFRGEVPPQVHVGARREGEEWQLWCRDNGIGVEPRYAERVFVIFQRLHPRDRYGGTGIGLAMCKRIVEYHGGRIWLEGDTGAGTTVRWTLPAVPGEAGLEQPGRRTRGPHHRDASTTEPHPAPETTARPAPLPGGPPCPRPAP